jgi:hypothetical protein
MGVPDGVRRIRQVLLTDEHERTVRHPPSMDVALGGGDLGEAAADLVGCFQHRHLHTLFGEGDGGSEPVGSAANHKRSGHATAPNRGSVAGRVHVTCSGIGPLGSQGCSFTASVTFQVPRSVTPSAASMTL